MFKDRELLSNILEKVAENIKAKEDILDKVEEYNNPSKPLIINIRYQCLRMQNPNNDKEFIETDTMGQMHDSKNHLFSVFDESFIGFEHLNRLYNIKSAISVRDDKEVFEHILGLFGESAHYEDIFIKIENNEISEIEFTRSFVTLNPLPLKLIRSNNEFIIQDEDVLDLFIKRAASSEYNSKKFNLVKQTMVNSNMTAKEAFNHNKRNFLIQIDKSYTYPDSEHNNVKESLNEVLNAMIKSFKDLGVEKRSALITLLYSMVEIQESFVLEINPKSAITLNEDHTLFIVVTQDGELLTNRKNIVNKYPYFKYAERIPYASVFNENIDVDNLFEALKDNISKEQKVNNTYDKVILTYRNYKLISLELSSSNDNSEPYKVELISNKFKYVLKD